MELICLWQIFSRWIWNRKRYSRRSHHRWSDVRFRTGHEASYTASMDDRFIAHFDNRWKQGSFGNKDIASERLTKPMLLFQTLWWKKCMPLKSMDAPVWLRAKFSKWKVKPYITLSLVSYGDDRICRLVSQAPDPTSYWRLSGHPSAWWDNH